MKKAISAAIAALLLAGCSQTLQAQSEYIDRVTHVEMPDDTYRIREHPKGDRLLITPSWGTIVKVGTQRGWTLGMAGKLPTDQANAAAARKHLDATGRAHCVLLSGSPLTEPFYQVIFDCPPAHTLPAQ